MRSSSASTHQHVRRIVMRTFLALIVVSAVAACGGDDDEDAGAAVADQAASVGGGDSAVEVGETAEEPADEATAGGVEPVDLGSIGRDVIVEMRVSMSSDDIARSVGLISAKVAALGGGVASSEVDYGDPASGEPGGFAVLVLKVPPASVGDLVGGLDDAGVVRSVAQSAQDVSDQLVDLDIRIDNARASVESVREFMDATEDLSELVTLEAELSRRLTELEQLEAQQRNLSDRVALATVTVEILPTASVPDPDSDDGIAGAFADGWHAFTALLYGIVLVAAVLTPFLVLAVAVLAAWWFLRKRAAGHPVPEPESREPDAAEHDDPPLPIG
jgi:hypothetical protein